MLLGSNHSKSLDARWSLLPILSDPFRPIICAIAEAFSTVGAAPPMAAIAACGRQAGSGTLSRVAASAWNLVSQPHGHLSPHEDVALHGSAPGLYGCPDGPESSSSQSIEDVYSSKPGFLWMGKGDKRTFRGKVAHWPTQCN